MSSNNRSPGSNAPLLIVALIGIGLGYGIGRVQGNIAITSLQEKLDTSTSNLKTANEAITAVEKKSARLAGRQYLAAAAQRLKEGDEAGGHAALQAASTWLSQGETDRTKPFIERVQLLAQTMPLAGKQSEVEKVGADLDALIPLPQKEGGIAGQ